MPLPPPRRPLETYSSKVLARWIQARRLSYFDAELQAIERLIQTQDASTHDEPTSQQQQFDREGRP